MACRERERGNLLDETFGENGHGNDTKLTKSLISSLSSSIFGGRVSKLCGKGKIKQGMENVDICGAKLVAGRLRNF